MKKKIKKVLIAFIKRGEGIPVEKLKIDYVQIVMKSTINLILCFNANMYQHKRYC